MRLPKVSVIVPIYNGEKTLSGCLSSILNQTYKDYEIILIDNNSTDNTKKIIQDFQKRHTSIKYVFEAKKGRGVARNKGINSVKGSIIVMTDSDCIVPKNWVEEITKPIINKKEQVVMGFEKDLINNFWTRSMQKNDWDYFKENSKEGYISHMDTKNIALQTSLIKKLMFDDKIGNSEDFELYLRLRELAKIRFIPSIKVGHYHKGSAIDVFKKNFDRAYWAQKIYLKYKKNKKIKNEPMFNTFSTRSFILFPIWMAFQFIKRPLKESIFLFIHEIAWRFGAIKGIIA